ncbi:MAG: hypothetical protein QM710_08005 [Flavobacterium sp.]
MKKGTLCLTILFLAFCSCEHKNKSAANPLIEKGEKITDTFYNAESEITEYFVTKDDTVFYSLEIRDSLRIKSSQPPKKGYRCEISWGKTKRFIDFDKEKIVFKTPETEWVNKDFICINTFSDLSIGYKLFIPYNPNEKLIFFDKDVEKTDPANNNMVYIDNGSFDGQMTIGVMNLKTKKKKELAIDISQNRNVYPFYDSLLLTKSKLSVYIAYPDRKLDLDLSGLY